jgi:RNA polymerase sigma factor (sigma-70 family)
MEEGEDEMASFSKGGFELLLARLDPDRERAGEKYQLLHMRLARVFEWRHCLEPEACADDALSRVARKLEEGTEIGNIWSYVMGVARRIALERYGDRRMEPIDDLETKGGKPAINDPEPIIIEKIDQERRKACVRKCLDRLAPESRDLVLSYYEDKSDRVCLADELGITGQTLRKRVERLCKKLRPWVTECLHPTTH